MTFSDRRRHARRRLSGLAVDVESAMPLVLTTAVVDLSAGGACIDWPVPDGIAVGSPLRLRFRVDGGQTIEIVGRIVRVAANRAGIEFFGAQQDLVRQILAETRSED